MDPLVITVALAGTPEAATADFVCDGVNDDVEINAALAQAGAAGGGIVRLAAGTYSTGLPIAIFDDNVAIEGDPAGGTVIRPDTLTWTSAVGPDGAALTAAVNFVGVDSFAARFLTVEFVPSVGGPPGHVDPTFNGIQAIPTGIDGAGEICTNGVFEGNTVRLAQGHTYSLWSLRSEGMQIIDNLIDGGSTVAGAASSQEGIEIYGGRDVLISGNTITGIGNAAIQLGGLAAVTPDCSVDNITVTGNSISNSRVGVFIGTTYGAIWGAADATNILIENNDFQALFEAGLMIRNWTGDAVDPPEVSNIVFRDNDVNLVTDPTSGYTPTAVWFLDLSGAGNSVTSGVLVEENRLSLTAVSAVPPSFWLTPGYNVFILIQGFEGASIVGNTVDMSGGSDASRAIVATGSSGLAITGNQLSGLGSIPVEFYHTHDFVIDGNVIEAWRGAPGVPGILVGEASAYAITGNVLHSGGGSGANLIIIYASDPATALDGNTRIASDDATLAGSLVQHLILAAPAADGIGNALDNQLTGNAQANFLDGGAGADLLDGGDGDDLLDGGTGADVLKGGLGDDWYIVDEAADEVIELADQGTDTVFARVSYTLAPTAAVERLYAEIPGDTTPLALIGNKGTNELRGNAGNNLLHGGGGEGDVLIGLDGDDIYYTDVASTQIVEAAGGGTDVLYTSVSYSLGGGVSVEVLSTNSHGATTAINLTGNSFNQTLLGNAGANILHGGGGTDILAGFGGDDIYYTDVAATLVVEAVNGGNDALYTSVSYVLGKGVEIETLSTNSRGATTAINLTGNAFDQTIIGNAGNNILHGGGGIDILYGFGGDDVYYTDVAATMVIEADGAGNDALYTSVSYALRADASVEILSTNQTAGTAALDLTGSNFANILVGNNGANVLDGKGGNDTLYGFGGADTFLFSVSPDAGNADTIGDFQQGLDRIGLSQAAFAGLESLGALPAGVFVTGTSAADSDDRIIYDINTGQLFYDADGSGAGAAYLFATLVTRPDLTASDFLVI